MITVRAGSGAIGVCLLLLAAGCSREQQDWRSAEAADTIESYGQFIQRHPESELATQARTRVAQLGEDRDWQHAGSADTVDAYRDFLGQHPNGKWAQEAHIRIDNFSLGEQAGTDAGTQAGLAARAGKSAGTDTVDAPAQTDSSGTADGATSRPAVTPAAANVAAPAVAGTSQTAAVGTGQGNGGDSTDTASPPGAMGTPAVTGSAAMAGKVTIHTAQTLAAAQGKAAGFGIQLGAFSTEAGANNEWHLLTARYTSELQGLQEHVVPANTASGRLYRLQAVVGSEGSARSICDLLRRHGQACVAVLPH
jgi:cell division septation protein DedD